MLRTSVEIVGFQRRHLEGSNLVGKAISRYLVILVVALLHQLFMFNVLNTIYKVSIFIKIASDMNY